VRRRVLPGRRQVASLRDLEAAFDTLPVGDRDDPMLQELMDPDSNCIRDIPAFEVFEEVLDEEGGVGADCVEPKVFRKPSKRLGKERQHAAGAAGVAAPEPAVHHELRACEHCQNRVMRGAAALPGIMTPSRLPSCWP
jgi:hypothetical protein